MPLYKYKEILLSAGITYALYFVNIICNILTARNIGPDSYGFFILAVSMQSLVTIITSLPLNWQFISSEGNQKEFDEIFQVGLILSILGIVVGAFTTIVIIIFYNYKLAILFLILVFGQLPIILSTLYIGQYEKKLKYKYAATLLGLSNTLGAVTCLVLSYSGIDLWSLLIREILPSMLIILKCYGQGYSYKGGFRLLINRRVINETINYSKSRVIEHLYFRLPQYLIGVFFGDKKLGVINQAIYLSSMPNTYLSTITERISYPYYIKNIDNKIILSKTLKIILIALVIFLMPVIYIFVVYGKSLVLVLYGEKWRDTGDILVQLAIFSFVLPIFSSLKTILFSLDKQHIVRGGYYIGTVILCSFILIAKFYSNLNFVIYGFGISILCGTVYFIYKLELYGIKIGIFKSFKLNEKN